MPAFPGRYCPAGTYCKRSRIEPLLQRMRRVPVGIGNLIGTARADLGRARGQDALARRVHSRGVSGEVLAPPKETMPEVSHPPRT